MTKTSYTSDSGRALETYVPRRTPWADSAGVRHWTVPALDTTPGMLGFSPDLVPLANHPSVVARESGVEKVLDAHLERFTAFTEHLELAAIVPVCLALRLGKMPFGVPGVLSAEAGKVAMDEIWHADCAEALRGGAPADLQGPPKFLATLSRTQKGLDRRQRALASTIFACCSETLITGTLKRVPLDTRVRADVRKR